MFLHKTGANDRSSDSKSTTASPPGHGHRHKRSGVHAKDESEQDKPFHVHGAGEYVGVTVTVNISKEYYISPIRPYYSSIVLIHEPWDFPEFSRSLHVIQPGEEVSVTVDLSMVVSAEDVNEIDQENRKCLFGQEQHLEMIDHYSFSNCVSECRARYITETCGCWLYTYPRFGE